MLFVGTILIAVGYTLIYMGVKGDHYKIGGQAVWKAPWLPFVATFSGASRTTLAADVTDSSNDEAFYQAAAAAAQAGASSPPPANASPQVTQPGSGQTVLI